MKKGDGITLKVAVNKNEPKCAWIVLKIDWGRQKVQASRNSGLDMKESEPRWFDFKVIDRVFRGADRDWEHMLVCEANGGKVALETDKESFNQFLRNCFFAMINRDDMESVPEYLDLPEIETPSVSEERSMQDVYLEEEDVDQSDSSWVKTENEFEELKSEDLKKEEWLKTESRFEDFEELSQESLSESKEILDKLEKEEEPEVKQEVQPKKETSKKILPRRKAKDAMQQKGAFAKYF